MFRFLVTLAETWNAKNFYLKFLVCKVSGAVKIFKLIEISVKLLAFNIFLRSCHVHMYKILYNYRKFKWISADILLYLV